MIKVVKNLDRHVICYVNTATWEVTSKYKGQTITTILGVGETLNIERDGTRTDITRISETEFRVKRYLKAA